MPDLTECAANLRAIEAMVEEQFRRIAPPKPRACDVEALPEELGPENPHTPLGQAACALVSLVALVAGFLS